MNSNEHDRYTVSPDDYFRVLLDETRRIHQAERPAHEEKPATIVGNYAEVTRP